MGESSLISDSVQTEQDMKQGLKYTSVVRYEEVNDITLLTCQHEQEINKAEAALKY